MKIILTEKQKTTSIIFLIVFCIQATDIKIGFIKVSELILLGLTPFFLFGKKDKFLYLFFCFFTFELLCSFLITYCTLFVHVSKSFLKMPYMISISRYIELLTCLTLSSIVYRFFKTNATKTSEILNRIVTINIYIIILFVIVYFLVIFKIIDINNSIIVYSDNRLRGLYFEGGPFGLMLCFVFMLTYFTDKKNRIYKQLFIAIVILFMAKSKAGFICLLFVVFIKNSIYLKEKFKNLITPVLIISFIAIIFIGKKMSYMYFDEINKIHESVQSRPNDTNLTMGRMAGIYIVPKMIKENPVFGIGLGTYPLLRNNKQYRGFFPLPPKEAIDKDSSGFGGLIDLLIDTGLIGFFLFTSILYLIFQKIYPKKYGVVLLLFLLLLFSFGVQLYFLYPWVLLAIILAYKNNFINEISN